MEEVFKSIAEEIAFIDFEGNADIHDGGKDFGEVLNVLLNGVREYDDVVDVQEAGFPFDTREDYVSTLKF